MRFFVIDQNWIAALVDGALTLAGTSAPAAAAMAMFRPDILAAAEDVSVRRRRVAAVPGQAAGDVYRHGASRHRVFRDASPLRRCRRLAGPAG